VEEEDDRLAGLRQQPPADEALAVGRGDLDDLDAAAGLRPRPARLRVIEEGAFERQGPASAAELNTATTPRLTSSRLSQRLRIRAP
jgi:hypothetical protein